MLTEQLSILARGLWQTVPCRPSSRVGEGAFHLGSPVPSSRQVVVAKKIASLVEQGKAGEDRRSGVGRRVHELKMTSPCTSTRLHEPST